MLHHAIWFISVCTKPFFLMHSCAMAWVVSHWPLTVEAQIQLQVSPCRMFGGQSGTGAGVFLLSVSLHQYHAHSFRCHWCCYNLSNCQCCWVTLKKLLLHCISHNQVWGEVLHSGLCPVLFVLTKEIPSDICLSNTSNSFCILPSYSLVILWFDAKMSELLTLSLNKLWIKIFLF